MKNILETLTQEEFKDSINKIMDNIIPDQYYPTSVRMHPKTRSFMEQTCNKTPQIWEASDTFISYKVIYDSDIEIGKIIFCNEKGVPIPDEKLIEYGLK